MKHVVSLVSVKVVPGASRDRIVRWGEWLKVCVTAPAERGRANEAVLELLCGFFGAPVTLRSGAGSPRKIVAVSLPQAQVQERIRTCPEG